MPAARWDSLRDLGAMSAHLYRLLHDPFTRPKAADDSVGRTPAPAAGEPGAPLRSDAAGSFTPVQNVAAVSPPVGAHEAASTTMNTGWLPPDDELGLAARAWVPVLITCGMRAERERCARLIHARSSAASHPFIVCCGGNGARRADAGEAAGAGLRRGFEDARGGVLFIDDLAEFTPDAQRELASLLEAHVAQSPKDAARVIAGASARLDGARRAGAFDIALFYRLNVIHLRPEDEAGAEYAER